MVTSKDGKLFQSIDCMPSEIFRVIFNVYNKSDMKWPSDIHLKKEDGNVEFEDLDINSCILPGTNGNIEFTIVSPMVEGKHVLILKLYDRSTNLSFGRKLTLYINVMLKKLEEICIAVPVSYTSPVQNQIASKETSTVLWKA